MLVRVARNLLADRRKPPLEKLGAEGDPERFVWSVLPHAGRTFGLCIACLPKRMALPFAVAYLYCRILDTYEDLVEGTDSKIEALRGFVDRFEKGENTSRLGEIPRLDPDLVTHAGDASHVLVVNRVDRVDVIFDRLSAGAKSAIHRLVTRMGEGMIWSTRVFAEQNGALISGEQLSHYCRNVLGNPIVFAEEMQRLDRGLSPELDSERERCCWVVGEVLQLANITRDLEKDVARGVYYHPSLRGCEASENRDARIRVVRRELVLRALAQADSLKEFVEGMPASRVSLPRGASLVLLLTTESYYRRAAKKVGLDWEERRAGSWWRGALLWGRGVLSRRATERILRDQGERFRKAVAGAETADRD